MSKKILILILDRLSNTRQITARVLTQDGYKVAEAADIKECLKKVENIKPDIVLIDHWFYDLDRKLCQKIKEINNLKYTFVLLLEKDKNIKHDNMEYCLKADFDGYITSSAAESETLARIAAISRIIIFQRSLLRKEEEKLKINKAVRLYAVISQINQAVVHEHNRDKLMQKVCDVAVEYGKFKMAWFGLVDKEKSSVIPVAHSGSENGYLSVMKQISIDDSGQGKGPTGSALKSGEYVICHDIATDPKMKPWKEEALKRGYRSSLALPIKVFGEQIGVYNLYSDTSYFFNDDEIKLLLETAQDISYAFENIEITKQKEKSEAKLEESEKEMSAVLDAIPNLLIVLSKEGRYIDIFNDGGDLIAGPPEELLGKTVHDVLSKEDANFIQKAIDEVLSTGRTKQYKYFITIKNRVKWFVAKVAKFKFQGTDCVLWSASDNTELKKAEQAVQKNENQLKITLNSIGDAVIATDIKGKVVRMNRIAEKLTGWNFTEAKGKPLDEVFCIVNEKSRKQVENPVNRSLAEGVIVGLANHTVLISKNGGEFNIADSAAPIIDADGTIFGVVLVFNDVTKQRNLERILQESEEKYRKAFKTSQDAVALSLISGEYVDINDGFIRLTGFAREDVIGKRANEIGIWAIPEDRRKLVMELGKKGTVSNFESQFRCKDGSLKTALLSANIIKLNGEPHILSITHDITERQKMRQTLKESESRFRALVEQSTDAMFLSDMDGNIIDVNRETCKGLGYSHSELLRMNVSDLDPVYAKNGYKNRLWEKLTLGNPVMIETVHKRKDGSIFPVEVNIGIVELIGKPAILGFARNISKRKLDEKLIIRKNKQLFLLSNASTEINKVLDLSTILERLVEIAIELTGSTSGSAALYQNKQMVFRKYLNNGKMTDINFKFDTGYGVPGHIMKTKKPYITNDAKNDKYVIRGIRGKVGPHQLIDVPILSKKGELLGCFEIYNTKDKRPYDKNDIEILQGLSANAAVATENAQMLLEQEKMKRELSFERDQFSFILNALPIGVAVLDKDDKYIFINPSTSKIDGFHGKIADLIGRKVKYNHSKEIGYIIDKIIVDFRSGKKTFHEREVGRGERTIKTSYHALYDKEKKYIGLIRIILDVTERKKAEMKIRESQQRLYSLLNNTPLGAIFWDLDFRIIDWNKAAEKIFGYTKNEILGKHAGIIVPLKLKDQMKDLYNNIINQTGGDRSVNENITKEGKEILCSWYNVAITDTNGKVTGVASLVEDITERSNIEAELEKSEQGLREAQKIAHIGHWKYYLADDNLLWSDEIYRIFGVSKGEFIGTHANFIRLIYSEDRKKADKAFHDSLKDGNEHTSNLRFIRQGTKEMRYLEVKYKCFKNDKGEVAGVMGTDQDVTEKTRLQHKIKEKEEVMLSQSRQAAMGEMISMIAHQWRQPLAVISMGMNNILADIALDTVKTEELKRVAQLILDQTKHLSETIDDFRNFFKPVKKLEEVLPKNVIIEALKFTGKSLEYYSIDVQENYRIVHPIKTYSRELLQVIIAVIQNAKDAIVQKNIKQGYIKIDAYESKAATYIKICDNAGGIDKKIIGKIFEPYFSTKEKQTGTGLGLYIAKIIMEKHLNGRIWAENTSDGACFIIEIER